MDLQQEAHMKILKTAIAAAFVAATIADPAVADPIQWSSGTGGNDHYYEAIRGANFINWEDARAAAAAKSPAAAAQAAARNAAV